MISMLLLVTVLLGMVFSPVQGQTEEEVRDALIAIVAAQPPFRDWLANYPNWIGQGNDDDGDGIWYIDFHSENWEEWLGWAGIDRATLTITDSFVPAPLSDSEYAEQLQAAREYILTDSEVLAWLDNRPERWATWEYFNRWDRYWELNYFYGTRAVEVRVKFDDNDGLPYVEGIYDRNALEEAEAQDARRNRAVELAYSAEGMWSALENADDWMTYVEWQYDAVWSVNFVVGSRSRVYVLVDLDGEKVLDMRVR
jgi:hypothetical protein